MAIIEYYSFSVSGDGFSPRQAEIELGVRFQSRIEKGEKSKRSGIVAEQGSGFFNRHEDLNDLLNLVEHNLGGFRRLGADEFALGLNVLHDGQCNFGLSHAEIHRISQLGLGIDISTFEDKEAIQIKLEKD